ncbi:peptidase A4 family-domain-containing protein [Mycena albidolilacea]|uniref:Peptidase A4 family-domain-containing protein n=1 Tax=Mycena albidolilacea TaxID=1033008 RepID=A0AAD6Z0M2_9AGAR|nr:peptidase A4 family-domain-containing protein [Mycena albidolilacea]
MKAAVITAILAASLATAEVTWTFQKFQNGTEVPFSAGPQTRFQSQAMVKVGEIRKRNRLNGRAAAATVTSSNWCGAALTGTGFTSVTGTWTVPTITLRSGQSAASDPALAQWVGIDGFSNSALIQGGTLSQLVGGRQENFAWTEMLPASLREVALTVDTGDRITTTVTMTSTTSGTVTIDNVTRGTSIVGTVSGGTRLSGTSAEWILEDFESGSSLIAFAAFPTSTFTGSAIRGGTSVSPSASTLIDIVQNSELCSATLSGTTVSVSDS